MEKVFPVELGVSSPSVKNDLGNGFRSASTLGEGRIQSVLGSGIFVASLGNGEKIEVRGSPALKIGDRVQVSLPASGKSKDLGMVSTEVFSSFVSESGFQWSALIPLAFGGKNAATRLEVFVEELKKGAWEKATPATYFVMTVQTEKLGEIQWSIYIKGHQVAIQVYAKMKEGKSGELGKLIVEIEETLQKKGFKLIAPAVVLNRPFKIPAGFRVNLRG